MLNITEIKTYINKATERFQKVFTDFEPPKIVVVPASRRQAVRNKVLKECGLDYKEDLYGTDAEVIDGPLDKQIVIYQSMMKSERQICHALWHEYGHIVFGNEKQYSIDLAEDIGKRRDNLYMNKSLCFAFRYSLKTCRLRFLQVLLHYPFGRRDRILSYV